MQYNTANQLTSRRFNSINYSYSYDANGNMLSDSQRSYQWTSFNKIARISSGADRVDHTYDVNRKRLKRTTADSTTWYVGQDYQHIETSSYGVPIVRSTHHIRVDGQVVASYQRNSVGDKAQTDKMLFMHRDILGNADRITNTEGAVVMARTFTPYGVELVDEEISTPESVAESSNERRAVYAYASAQLADPSSDYLDTALLNRYRRALTQLASYSPSSTATGSEEDLASQQIDAGLAQMQDDAAGTESSQRIQLDPQINKKQLRGYTGHEHIEEAGLINMNARLYDPVIARFISADTLIPDPGLAQAYNRYAYAIGNPVKYTDPDGHWIFAVGLALTIGSQLVDDPQLSMAMGIAGSAMMGYGLIGTLGKRLAGVMSSGAVLGAINGFIAGEDSEGILRSAGKGALYAGVAYGTGHGGTDGGHIAGDNIFAQSMAHGVTQAVAADVVGDNMETAFYASIAGHGSKVVNDGLPADWDNLVTRTTVSSVFGGTAAHLSGGQFGRGAYHAAMVHLFNYEMTAAKARYLAQQAKNLHYKLGRRQDGMSDAAFIERFPGYAKKLGMPGDYGFAQTFLAKQLNDFATKAIIESVRLALNRLTTDLAEVLLTPGSYKSPYTLGGKMAVTVVDGVDSFIGLGGDYPNLYIGCNVNSVCMGYYHESN